MTSLDPVKPELRQGITGHTVTRAVYLLHFSPNLLLLRTATPISLSNDELTGAHWAPLVPFPVHMEKHLLFLLSLIIFSVGYWHQLPGLSLGAAAAGLCINTTITASHWKAHGPRVPLPVLSSYTRQGLKHAGVYRKFTQGISLLHHFPLRRVLYQINPNYKVQPFISQWKGGWPESQWFTPIWWHQEWFPLPWHLAFLGRKCCPWWSILSPSKLPCVKFRMWSRGSPHSLWLRDLCFQKTDFNTQGNGGDNTKMDNRTSNASTFMYERPGMDIHKRLEP